MFSVPKSIFLPMFILIMGIGFQQKVAYAAFSTLFVVIMSATAAVESVRADHVLVARSYGATRMQILTRVYVPSMMPILLETLRISMIFNFTGVMIAEMYASRTGIGHLISNWGENFQLAAAVRRRDPARRRGNRVQRDRALPGTPLQRVANMSTATSSIVRDAPANAAIEVAGLSHIYAGRDGKVPALHRHCDDGRRRALRGDRRPERLRQDLAADDDGGPAPPDLRHDPHPGPRRSTRPIRTASASCSRRRACFPGSRRSTTSSFRSRCAARRATSGTRARNDMLNLVGLQGFGSRYPHELSGGMKQRVSIARGLVQDPPVLLMDEPFAALDEQTRMTMGHELLRIWSQTAKTVVFVTHSLTEAVYLADEVLVMSARPGRIIDRIAIALPRPRTYEMMATDVFGRLRDRIWQQIRKEG